MQMPTTRAGIQPRTIPITRSLHLLLTNSATLPESAPSAAIASHPLAFSPGGTDELPEGPNGFDVLEDGRLLITDPLRLRISVFDPRGAFLQSWPIGFAADSITAGAEDTVLIREAKTGSFYKFNREGKQLAGPTFEPPAPPLARLLDPKHATLARPCGAPLSIAPGTSDTSLLSLEYLDTGPSCVTFVALESSVRATTADAIDVRKSVRRYSADGHLLSETSDLPLDYYILPVNELRVHHGIVYQLRTTRTEVSINEWDMNESALLSMFSAEVLRCTSPSPYCSRPLH